jgi:hypothetical protein
MPQISQIHTDFFNLFNLWQKKRPLSGHQNKILLLKK